MGIKITSAQEAGIGRRTPGAIAEGTPRPIPEIRTGIGLEVAQAVTQIAGQVHSAQLAAKEKAQRESAKGREQVQKAIGLIEKNMAAIDYAQLNSDFTAKVEVLKSQNLPIKESTKKYNEFVAEHEKNFKSLIPEGRQSEFGAKFINSTAKVTSGFTKYITDMADTNAIAQGKTTIDALVNRAGANTEERKSAKSLIGDIVKVLPMDAEHKTALLSGKKALIDNNAVVQRLNERNGGVYRTELDGLIVDLEAKDADGNFKNFKDLPAKARTSLLKQAEDARITDNNSRQTATNNLAKKVSTEVTKFVDSGGILNQEQRNKVLESIKGTPYEQKVKDKLTEGIDPAKFTEKVAKDPLGVYSVNSGIEIPTLDITVPPGEMLKQVQSLAEFGLAVKNAFNLSYIPMLRPQQVQAVTSAMNVNKASSIQLFTQMFNQIDQEAAIGLAIQVSQKDPANGSILRALANKDTVFANNLAEGQDLRKKKAVTMPKGADIRTWFDDLAGNSLIGYPNNGIDAFNDFQSIYAVQISRNGVTDGLVDNTLAAAAFEKVVGVEASINGFNTIMQDGLKETDFRDGIGGIVGSTILENGGVAGMEDIEAARRIKSDGQFYSAAPGLYRVMLNGQVLVLKNNPNVPVQFDITPLMNKPDSDIPTTNEQSQVDFGFGLF